MCANSGKPVDQGGNSISKNSECEDGWLVGYPSGGLVEKYLSGDMAIAWRRAEPIGGNSIEDGFILQMLKPPLDIAPERSDAGIGNLRLYGQEPFVLSQNVELVDGVKYVIPSVIRFCAFDRGCLDGGYPLFVFEHVYGVEKLGGQLSDGKVGLAIRFFAIADQQRRHQQIECSTGGIDDGPDISVDEWIKDKIGIGHEQIPLFVGRIRLGDDFVWASPLPLDEAFLQNWDMGLGPIDGVLGV